MVRALRAHAVETFLVAPRTAVVARSRGVIVLDDGWTIERSAHSLWAFLGNAGLERGVLVPCDDDWLRVIAELRDLAADPFAPAAPPPAIVDTFVDKAAFARTLESLDIDRPRTLEVTSPEDPQAVAASELSSFFLKPRDSQRFTEAFQQKASGSATAATPRARSSERSRLAIDSWRRNWYRGYPTTTSSSMDSWTGADGS